MSVTLEIKTKNYVDDLLSIKKSLSHMETIVGEHNGYTLSEPELKFGWTFFKLAEINILSKSQILTVFES